MQCFVHLRWPLWLYPGEREDKRKLQSDRQILRHGRSDLSVSQNILIFDHLSQ